MTRHIAELLKLGPVLGDGGYLIELERRGYVDSGSGREKVGTGRGSGQFTPEVAIEHPEALRELHREFLRAGSQVLQALKLKKSTPPPCAWPRRLEATVLWLPEVFPGLN